MTGMTFDGISSTQDLSTQTSGTTSQATSGLFTRADITTLNATTITGGSGTNISNTFGVLGNSIGSPVTYGLSIQAGSAATSAGSIVWVTFAAPFAATPVAFLTTVHGSGAFVTDVVGSRNPGSTYCISNSAASKEFSWLAIGSGRF